MGNKAASRTLKPHFQAFGPRIITDSHLASLSRVDKIQPAKGMMLSKPSKKHADSVFYGIAAEEMQAGRINKGLMAKAIAKANGDKKKAEVLYLEWRVDLLTELAVAESKNQEEQKVFSKKKQTAVNKSEKYTKPENDSVDQSSNNQTLKIISVIILIVFIILTIVANI